MAIYLDHNATTPIAPGVLDAMRPYLELWSDTSDVASGSGAGSGWAQHQVGPSNS